MVPLPEHYMKTIPVKDAAAKSYPLSADIAKAPTSGPYKYVTASADTVELTRNDNWAAATIRPTSTTSPSSSTRTTRKA